MLGAFRVPRDPTRSIAFATASPPLQSLPWFNIFRNIFFTTLQFSVIVSFCINEKLCGNAGAELSHC